MYMAETSGSRSGDRELVTDSPGVELAGKQVWDSMASNAQATVVC